MAGFDRSEGYNYNIVFGRDDREVDGDLAGSLWEDIAFQTLVESSDEGIEIDGDLVAVSEHKLDEQLKQAFARRGFDDIDRRVEAGLPGVGRVTFVEPSIFDTDYNFRTNTLNR